jgi:hypothetical protein
LMPIRFVKRYDNIEAGEEHGDGSIGTDRSDDRELSGIGKEKYDKLQRREFPVSGKMLRFGGGDGLPLYSHRAQSRLKAGEPLQINYLSLHHQHCTFAPPKNLSRTGVIRSRSIDRRPIMDPHPTQDGAFFLPDDLLDQVNALALRLGESPQNIIIAAVDHLMRIPEEQRKAVLRGTSMRRGGY